jgi:hypothetical protein
MIAALKQVEAGRKAEEPFLRISSSASAPALAQAELFRPPAKFLSGEIAAGLDLSCTHPPPSSMSGQSRWAAAAIARCSLTSPVRAR